LLLLHLYPSISASFLVKTRLRGLYVYATPSTKYTRLTRKGYILACVIMVNNPCILTQQVAPMMDTIFVVLHCCCCCSIISDMCLCSLQFSLGILLVSFMLLVLLVIHTCTKTALLLVPTY
jgi:hypothetical protein